MEDIKPTSPFVRDNIIQASKIKTMHKNQSTNYNKMELIIPYYFILLQFVDWVRIHHFYT
jgi:hypothetical protein